jgi:1,2-diacylglycerol 3-alpha-glucosyltransferase
MKICMMTNTYLPHVGGVARSVSTFAEEFIKRGHEVLVVAPEFDGPPLPQRQARIVLRAAAIQNFNGSDFSVTLPLSAALSERLDAFHADIVHAHHPFLLGDTALRIASKKNVPVIFTHHTLYEDYTHYVPFDSPTMKEVAINLSTGFANLCDGVIAPSGSIAKLIRKRGVESPIAVVPTGVDVEGFASGDGARARRKFRIPAKAFVVGHTGRLAPEKNLGYLARAVAQFLKMAPGARFLVVGGGPSEEEIREICDAQGVADRLILAGKHTGRALHDAFRAMDVFAFSSFSETQGMVLAEAMAAGVPVVALRANGVVEVVKDSENGFMLPARSSVEAFAERLKDLHDSPAQRRQMRVAAQATANEFSAGHCADLALEFYEKIRKSTRRERLMSEHTLWGKAGRRLAIEWDLLTQKTETIAVALKGEPEAPVR